MIDDPDEMIDDPDDLKELVFDVPAEVIQRIEKITEARWMNEFRVFAQNAEERVNKMSEEMVRWRFLSTSLARKANIGHPIFLNLMLPDKDLSEEEQQQYDMLLDKFELYIRMGMDFEKVITAIQSNDGVNSCWERLLVAMKLAGLDEPSEN